MVNWYAVGDFAQKVTCQQYSTASAATGWHTPRTNHQNLGVMSSVPSGRFLTKIRVFVQSPVRAGVDQVKRYVLLVLLTTLSDHFILNLPTELSAMLPKYRKPFLSTAFAISA